MKTRFAWSLPILVAVVLSSGGPFAAGSEGDPYTQRRYVLSGCIPDAQCVLDRIANDRIQRALDEAKRHGQCCDRCKLEKVILKYLGNMEIARIELPIGPQELEINKGRARYLRDGLARMEIPSVTIKKRDSIYQDLTIRESPGTAASIGAIVKFGDLVISSDKFTHFFAQGYDYLEIYRCKGTMEAALCWGIESERGKKGLEGTGVMSYGDLAANYAGFMFWMQLTDPVCGHIGCCNGKWVQTRCFSWREHVTPAWDEAINIGCFQCGSVAQKIQTRIGDLVRRGCIDHCPPLDHHKLAEIPSYYDADVLPRIINPVSLKVIQLRPADTQHEPAPDAAPAVLESVGVLAQIKG